MVCFGQGAIGRGGRNGADWSKSRAEHIRHSGGDSTVGMTGKLEASVRHVCVATLTSSEWLQRIIPSDAFLFQQPLESM